MKYDVYESTNSPEIFHGVDLSKKAATTLAEKLAAEGKTIFISFFRKSDGQHGHLNRDGHSITGQAW